MRVDVPDSALQKDHNLAMAIPEHGNQTRPLKCIVSPHKKRTRPPHGRPFHVETSKRLRQVYNSPVDVKRWIIVAEPGDFLNQLLRNADYSPAGASTCTSVFCGEEEEVVDLEGACKMEVEVGSRSLVDLGRCSIESFLSPRVPFQPRRVTLTRRMSHFLDKQVVFSRPNESDDRGAFAPMFERDGLTGSWSNR